MNLLTQRLMMSAGSRACAVLESGAAFNTTTVNFTTTPAANTLILFFGMANGSNVVLPSGYTLIAERTGSNPRFLCGYKIAVGTETNVSGNNAEIVAYAFVSIGATLDITGTVATSGSNTVTANGITPAIFSRTFLVGVSANASTTLSQNGTDWTNIISSIADTSVNRELAVWTKEVFNGASTENVTITWQNNNGAAAVQFSVK